MAIYENLPVFKQTYDLLLEVYGLSKNLSRDYRYTLGEEIKKRVMAMMVCIYRANSSAGEVKTAHLKNARECVVEIKLHIRLLSDLKQIGFSKQAVLTEHIESISKQITAWAKSVK